METLLAKQVRFVTYLGRLYTYASDKAGILVVAGEAWRTPEQSQWNAEHGKGIAMSLHRLRLAQDLIVMRAGSVDLVPVWDSGAVEYRLLGTFWKMLAPDCCWGGDFTKPDAGHFSITHDGVR